MNTYNIFISHSWAYSDAYVGLIRLLGNRSCFNYNDYSVPKDDPIHNCGTDAQLYQAIKQHMQPCHVIIIMAGVYSTYSKWIDKEIEIAKTGFSYPKPIVAVRPFAQTNISAKVSQNANTIVAWNTESIINAIRSYAK